ncbi:MAG: hypothetical protein CR994_01575 [Maribacter sp.]|nr:MAG: hypothetical protein CR994_01575 [Maribacter sp.]
MIPKLHENLLWDLSLLIVTLTVLYFIAIRFLSKGSVIAAQKGIGMKQRKKPYVNTRIPAKENDFSKVGPKPNNATNRQVYTDNIHYKGNGLGRREDIPHQDLDLDFLPRVIDKDEIGDSAVQPPQISGRMEINDDELAFLPLVVANIEVGGGEQLKKDVGEEEGDTLALGFLPLVTDEGNTITGDCEKNAFYNSMGRTTMDDGDINESNSFAWEDVGGIGETTDKHLELRDISAKLPSPILFEGETFINRHLLDDIEAFGDRREIPLRSKSRNKASLGNVQDYLKKEFSPFSVFKDLFRNCDTEAKLILMDMIVEVGDEKEVDFLRKVSKDPDNEIRTKAIRVLRDLENKIFRESLLFDPSEIFDVIPRPKKMERNRKSYFI